MRACGFPILLQLLYSNNFFFAPERMKYYQQQMNSKQPSDEIEKARQIVREKEMKMERTENISRKRNTNKSDARKLIQFVVLLDLELF